MTTIASTHDVQRRTTVKSVYVKGARPKALPKPTKGTASALFPKNPHYEVDRPNVKIELIGDGDMVLVDGVMSRKLAMAMCQFMALLTE